MGAKSAPSCAEDVQYVHSLHSLAATAILVSGSLITAAAVVVSSLFLLIVWQRLLPCLLIVEAAGAGNGVTGGGGPQRIHCVYCEIAERISGEVNKWWSCFFRGGIG